MNIDITVYLDGFHGDTSRTFLVGDVVRAIPIPIPVPVVALLAGEGDGSLDFTLVLGAGIEDTPIEVVEVEGVEVGVVEAIPALLPPNPAAFCRSCKFRLYPNNVPRFSLCPGWS